MPRKLIMIMAGGTGGHVYPALAVADYLKEHGMDIVWLGTESGLESRVVTERGYKLTTITISGLRGKGVFRWIIAPFMLLLAIIQSMLAIGRFKPDVVLGMGGFVSGPGGIASWLSRIPLFIHEQNAIAGLTNRILSKFAIKIMQGFPGTFPTSDKVITTGNPVRKEIINIEDPDIRIAKHTSETLRLLILGGSQGAKKINQLVPSVIKQLNEEIGIEVWHQVGQRHLQDAKNTYSNSDISKVRIEPFIEDMAAAYSWADIILCRAGALTIAELCVVGLASILVPYPYAVDDHQTANARFLTEAGAGILIQESDLEASNLTEILKEFYHARERLIDMAKKARDIARPDATLEVSTVCLECVNA